MQLSRRCAPSCVPAMMFTLLACWAVGSPAAAQDAPVAIIDFDRDVRPILELKCIHCHGAEDAKNGFRVDDEESMLGYLEPEDIESSSLWTDYLHTDDPDMLMPPAGSDGQPAGLTGAELATIKLWIEEGAHWNWSTVEVSVDPELELAATAPLAARIWAFQGLFHPASVHFPVALLMISGLFVFLSFFSRTTFEPAAFHCLWIGALGAVASCIMGWSYAVHEGYGQVASLDLNSAIDRHRWLGIAVAVVSVAMIPLASSARKINKGGVGKRLLWFFASMIVAGGISMVGYQGGELVYGEDHYEQEFKRLFPEAYETTEAPKEAPGEAVGEAAPEETEGEVDVEPEGDEPDAVQPQSQDTQRLNSESVTEISVPESPFPADEPATGQPPAAASTSSESAVSEPGTTEPATTEPATTEPGTTEPATTEPGGASQQPAEPEEPPPAAESEPAPRPETETESEPATEPQPEPSTQDGQSAGPQEEAALPPMVVNPPQPGGK